jgi:organic radical activating enzyme
MSVSVSEMFLSVQGEGRFLGWPMTFVRLSHCNIECAWCDTPQRYRGAVMTEQAVADAVEEFDQEHVCLTGGEPMLQLRRMAELVSSSKWKWHLETNGTLAPAGDIDLLEKFECITVSPKLSSAQHSRPVTALAKKSVFVRDAFEAWVEYARTTPSVYFKFVVGSKDWCEFERLVESIPNGKAVVEIQVQPQTYEFDCYGEFARQLLVRVAKGWPMRPDVRLRYMPRLQDLLWGDAPGR